MKRGVWPSLTLAVVLAWVICVPAEAISIAVTGAWGEIVDESDLQGGPGSSLASTYESAADEVVIDITSTSGSDDNWRVDVRRSDTTWHEDLVLWMKRTSNGNGDGTISGGTAYQQITSTDTPFFSGSGNRTTIYIQEKLTGVSTQMFADNYATTLIYTVVDVE